MIPGAVIRRVVAAVVAAAALLVATGCAAPSPTATAVAIPDTPVGERTAWVIDVLNAAEESQAREWKPVLHPDFLAEVSADEIAQLVNEQLRPAGPFTPTAYDGDEHQAVTTLAGRVGDPLELVLVLDDRELVTGMLFRPATPPHEPATSLDEVADRLAALPVETRWVIQRDGERVAGELDDRLAPLGSIFKLWVLIAVVEAVDAGELSWDDPLVITDAVRSLPSGRLPDEPDGTEVTVAEAARLMIEISDNTAADLLAQRVGREAVEAAVASAGHAEPAAMRPFPTTRELFQLLAADDALVQRWATAGESQRREILAELAAAPLPAVEAIDQASTRWPLGVEWFASADDVAAAHAVLAAAASRPPEVAAALTANPGVAVEGWATVAFKGGSSPGVLTGSWLATADDGSTVTLVILASDDDAQAVADAAGELFGLAADALAIEAAAR